MHLTELERELKVTPEAAPKWPYMPQLACSGNCNQGRGCDCLPDYEPTREDRAEAARFWRWALLGLVIMVCVVGGGILAGAA